MERKLALSKENLVHGVALLTTVMGVVNVISAILPSMRDRLHLLRLLGEYSPFSVRAGGHLASALAGFALLLLSVSLWRRKQMGWLLTLSILIVSIPVHLLKGLDYEEATFAALLAGLLIFLRQHFHARSDLPSVRQGLQILLAALLFTLVYGVIGFYLLDRHFNVMFGFWSALRQTIVIFTQFYDPGLEPVTGFGKYFINSIYVISAATIGYALLMLLRPVLNRRSQTEGERSRAWEIARAHGRTSLARYALLDDKLFFFTDTGSLVSYVVENRVALALGDPIGPDDDAERAISSFKDFCSQNDWLPAFYQVSPTWIACYKSLGFEAISIGREAIVDLTSFSLTGRENKTLRNSYNKLQRLGYHYDVIEPPHSTRMLRELKFISDDWLTARGATELRFSLGWFDPAYLNTCPILLARDREGFIAGFATVVTEFQANEITVDLMRYLQHGESGLMDFLFVSLFQWAHERGHSTFNLGLSALSGVGEHSEDPIVERALNFMYQNVDRFYNFRGLHSFKEKFHPIWSQRYLAYPAMSNLPAISVALFRASFGGTPLSLFRHR